jgi:hypothetical protein
MHEESTMPDAPLDRWIQRLALAALLAVAAALVTTGVSLYGPRAHAAPVASVAGPD